MAISIVQSAETAVNTTNPKTVSFGSNVTTGNAVIVCSGWQDATVTYSSTADTESNSYTASTAGFSSPMNTVQVYNMNVTGGFTDITVTLSGTPTARFYVVALEIEGLDPDGGYEDVAAGSGTTSSLSVSAFTPSVDDCIVVASCAQQNSGATFTEGTGYTIQQKSGTGAVETRILTSASQQTAPITSDVSVKWVERAVTYTGLVSSPTNTSINIGDTWKEIDWANSSINIGDTWKTITEVSVNIGDVWKAVYAA